MIHKVERLVSIGKFRNYSAAGDITFKKLTLIYADNGSGKTTLSAVFRSLTQNRPEIIHKRISTNFTDAQVAQIVQTGTDGTYTHHTLRPNGWSNPFPDIEIFDIHFVNENIYSGFDFNEEHKKQLHEFVIGAQGVMIQQQMDQNKYEKTNSRQLIQNYESEIINLTGNGLTSEMLPDFLRLNPNELQDIRSNILMAEGALNSAKANAVIQTLESLSEIRSITCGIDFEALISDLKYSTQTIQDVTLKSIFGDHCGDLSANSIADPENWLRKGFNYIKNKRDNTEERVHLTIQCPLCQQTIANDLDILKAYTSHFNDEFNSLALRLEGHLKSIVDFNLEATIQSIRNIIVANNQRTSLWTTHLPTNILPVDLLIIADEEVLNYQFQSLIGVIRGKCQNPTVPMSIEEASNFQSSLEYINRNIEIYNRLKTAYNDAISSFRTGIQTEQLAQIEVNKLKRIEKRFDPAIDTICQSLLTENQNLRDLERIYTRLTSDQTAQTAVFFSTYKDKINHYLIEVFRTPFKIEGVQNVTPRGRATHSKIGYKLTMNDCDISFDTDQPNSAKECFSEGDKSTIALAFFLAKMDIDPRLPQKILIFDDPLSSLDRNRRLNTVNLIKGLFSQIQQVIVLSHNEFFLSDLSKGIERGQRRALRITENFMTRSSSIEPIDLDTLVENEYFKHIKEVEGFLANPDINQKDRVLGLMRNILEAHICFKFYRQTIMIAENSRTFGRLIDILVEQNVVFRSDSTPPSNISKLRLINSVSCKPHHGEPEPDYRTLGCDPDTMSIVELAGLVQDTLDLIDHKL